MKIVFFYKNEKEKEIAQEIINQLNLSGAYNTKIVTTLEVFKKFYKERPKKTGGLGIGLSICKAIIEFHKWTLEAHNNDIGGVTFRIIIPFRKGELK